MKKRGKKVVSLLLAATLTCSTVAGAATAFAAENADVTYEATYTQTAPKATYDGMLADASKLIGDALWTADTLETIWTVLPSLSAICNDGGSQLSTLTADYYVRHAGSVFAELPAFMEEHGYDVEAVSAETFTGVADDPATPEDETAVGFFDEHPLVVNSGADFAAGLDVFIEALAIDNVASTLMFAGMFGIVDSAVFTGIDDVLTAIGAYCGTPLLTSSMAGGAGLQAYLKYAAHALIPDTAEGLMNALRNIAVPENSVKLYEGLNTVLNGLGGVLGMLGVSFDIAAIQEVVASLPTTEVVIDGEAKTAFDINGILDYVINDVVVPMVGEQLGADVVSAIETVLTDLGLSDLKLASFDGSKAVLKFDAVNMANLAAADDAEDALNVVLHYLYTNLNKPQNKLVLLAVNGIASLVNVLPAEVSTILNAVLKQSEPDAVATIAAMLAKLANRNPVTAVTIEQGENVVLSAGKNGNMYTGSVQLTAVVTPDNATNKDITWSSNIENVTVDANGLVSYKGTLDVPFDATITATAVGGASDTITVHIEKASVTGVSLDTVYAELNEGATLKLNAKVAPANAENKDVTWSTDNEAVATVAADGTVTAVAPGTAKITVTTVDGGLTAICVVEVRADKTALNALLDKVAGMELVEENYDADKWAAYEAALDAAEATAAEELATQAEVNAAVAALNAALKALPAGVDLTEVKIVSTSDTLEGNVIYHKVPWYKTWMSQTVDLALEYTEGAEIVSVQWQAANWSIDDPEAKIENADNDSATIRPTFGIGTRSFWVQAVVTDVNGNVVTSDPVKVRFYNWDWQK